MGKKFGIIYIYINKISGMKYIGQTIDFKSRQQGHLNSKANNYFDNSLQKNGLENFEVWQSINKMSNKDMNFWEETLIDLYPTLFPNGYNLRTGGNKNQKFCEESKEKNRQAHLGIKKSLQERREQSNRLKKNKKWNKEQNPQYGKKWTKKQKEEQSKKLKGRFVGKKHPMYGKHPSEETIQKQSKSKIGKHIGKDNPNAKSVICLNTLEVFDTIREACKKYNINKNNISTVCKNNKYSAGKDQNGNRLYWLYYNDYLKLNDDEKYKLQSLEDHRYSVKKVICLNTLEVFNSIIDAIKKLKVKGIVLCCQGKRKSAGKDQNGIPLKWMYYSEYLLTI